MTAQIKDRIIEEEMKTSFLDYAMSIIVSRALPDVRDGLKPVHRRILFTMKEMGLTHNSAFKKCARIVGDTMGKYHPHGNLAVYDSLVRMAQNFLMRYTLVNGQGNFGNIDGDPPAADRYTEARLQKVAEELLDDLDKDTVDFAPNYDGSLKEPVVLPARIPNLLINGSAGIAVGMATNIPPHNLIEICQAVIHLIDNPDADVGDLMNLVKGPDFPTGGIIEGANGIKEAYQTGRGKIKVVGKMNYEETKNHHALIITEIPFMLNKTALIEQIADLVKTGKIDGVKDIRDESNRKGMRLLIILKKDANKDVVENQIMQYTRFRTTFGMNMLTLVNREPKRLTLVQFLKYFVDHRKDVLFRKARFDLKKAEEKAHKLEGLSIALDHIDDVVALIKSAASAEDAEKQLIGKYEISQIQAKTILEMRLQRLTSLEQEKIRNDLKETKKLIESLKEFLESSTLVLEKIKEEMNEMIEKYGDERRTKITGKILEVILPEDLIEEEDMVITLSSHGNMKRTPLALYKVQQRGGKGVIGSGTKEDDFVEHLFVASTHDYLLFFTNQAKVYWRKVHELPEAGRTSKGRNIANILSLSKEEIVSSVIPVSTFEDEAYLVTATKNGIVKKTPLKEYSRPRQGGIIALTLSEGDELINARITRGNDEIILLSKKGFAVRFNEQQARPIGRTSRGVTGMRLTEGDKVVSMLIRRDGTQASILTLTERGFGKQTLIDDYRIINRGGKGVISIKTTERNGNVVAGWIVQPSDEVMLISKEGIIIRTKVSGISSMGRNTQGVRIMRLDPDDVVKAIAKIDHDLGGE